MRVLRDLAEVPSGPDGAVVSIGFYDGVHLGHRAVLGAVRGRAEAAGYRSTVVTFDRHPAQVLRPDSAPRLLCDLDQKLELLATTGVDETFLVHFDAVRAQETAEHFVSEVLVAGLRARLVVVGEDFHFGYRRGGNVALLADMGAVLGFDVIGHDLVGIEGHHARPEEQVSSTAIRRALTEGRLEAANAMLGRPHEMRGPVVDGDRRGREIGFPTANVAIDAEMVMPADGIYAGRLLRPDGAELPAAIYVGHRPTFYEQGAATLLEVHCLDFAGDLYGERVAVRLEHRLRGDRRFDSVDALTAQLARDCDDARRLLSG